MGGATGGFYFEHATDDLDEDEVAANAMVRAKTLACVPGGGLKSGDIVEVSDGATSLKFELKLVHVTELDEAAQADGFAVQGELQAPPPEEEQAPPAGEEHADAKRKRDDGTDGAEANGAKKARAEEEVLVADDDDVIVL
jgi:hypothetical protein